MSKPRSLTRALPASQTQTVLENAMPFIPAPLGVRVAMEFTKDGQTVVNVYHVSCTQPLITANLTAIGNAFLAWWVNELRTVQSSALVLARIVVTDVSQQEGQQAIVVPTVSAAGAVAGTDAPNNVALVVTHRTAQIGRTRRGRTYLPGVPAASVAGSTYNTSAVAAILAAYGALAARLTPTSSFLVVASYQFNGQPREAAVLTAVTAFTANDVIDTQRRRVPGRGN